MLSERSARDWMLPAMDRTSWDLRRDDTSLDNFGTESMSREGWVDPVVLLLDRESDLYEGIVLEV